MSERCDEMKLIAEHLRVMHKPAGGVCVLFIEEAECPFGFAIPHGLEDRSRRYGVSERDVYVDVEPRVVHAWRMGSLQRPTSSPHVDHARQPSQTGAT